jgi:hypothetical protein
MQLETGKSKHGLVGSFKNIIAQEGYVWSLFCEQLIFTISIE